MLHLENGAGTISLLATITGIYTEYDSNDSMALEKQKIYNNTPSSKYVKTYY